MSRMACIVPSMSNEPEHLEDRWLRPLGSEHRATQRSGLSQLKVLSEYHQATQCLFGGLTGASSLLVGTKSGINLHCSRSLGNIHPIRQEAQGTNILKLRASVILFPYSWDIEVPLFVSTARDVAFSLAKRAPDSLSSTISKKKPFPKKSHKNTKTKTRESSAEDPVENRRSVFLKKSHQPSRIGRWVGPIDPHLVRVSSDRV